MNRSLTSISELSHETANANEHYREGAITANMRKFPVSEVFSLLIRSVSMLKIHATEYVTSITGIHSQDLSDVLPQLSHLYIYPYTDHHMETMIKEIHRARVYMELHSNLLGPFAYNHYLSLYSQYQELHESLIVKQARR
jgi:hypothetical protein